MKHLPVLWLCACALSFVACVSNATTVSLSDQDAIEEEEVAYLSLVNAPPSPASDDEVLAEDRPVSEDDDSPVDRLALIRRTWKTSPVISLQDFDSNILQEIVQHESPVYLAVLFVSSSSLAEIESFNRFDSIARAYWAELERKKSVSTSKLYFLCANASFSSSRALFKDHRISKVPTLILIPKSAAYPSRGVSFAEEWTMEPSQDIFEFLESHTTLKLPLTSTGGFVNPNGFLHGLASTIENWGLYLIVLQVLILLGSNYQRFGSKSAWMFLSIAVYFFSSSGVIYCFLRGAAPFGYSEQYGLMFVYPDRSSQFLLEGVMIGLVNCGISLAFVLAGELALGDDVIAKMEEWFDGIPPERIVKQRLIKERYGNAIPLPLREERIQKLLKTAMVLIGVVLVLIFNLFVVFRRKAPWYRPFSL